jgi:hypothetical protein
MTEQYFIWISKELLEDTIVLLTEVIDGLINKLTVVSKNTTREPVINLSILINKTIDEAIDVVSSYANSQNYVDKEAIVTVSKVC